LSSIFAWAAALLLAACARTPEDPVVARVGDQAITRKEVEEFAASLLPGLRSAKSGQQARRDYLQTLIDEKLLVRQARDQGLDTARALVADLERACRQKAVEAYTKTHLEPRIHISEEDLEARFAAEGLARERALRRLVVRTRAEAEQLRAALEGGADFAALASSHSLEKSRAARGGYLGFIDRTWAARLQIPPQVFESLPAGRVSAPLPLRDAWQLILFAEERSADFKARRPRLQRAAWKEQLSRQHRAAAEELAHEFGLRVERDGLEILRHKRPGLPLFPPLSEQEAAAPLYIYERGQITAGEYLDAFRRAGVRPGLGDSLEVARAAWQLVIPEYLFCEAARREGYLETPAFLQWKERKEVELLLRALRQRAVSDPLALTDEEIEQFYRENPRLFAVPAELWIQEILLEDAEQAAQVRQRLDAGEDIAGLVQLSQRPGAAQTGGKLHLHSYEAPIYGELVPRALEAEPGQWVGPVATGEGYSVFRLLEKSGGQAQPFAAVRDRVKATLRFRREEELFAVLVRAVREQYAGQVRVFPEALGQVRLP